MMHARPDAGIVAVKVEPDVQSRLRIWPDRCGGALSLANATVDTLIGMDDEHVLAFIKTFDRADVHTVHIFAGDAVFGDDIGHLGARTEWQPDGGCPAAPEPTGRTR